MCGRFTIDIDERFYPRFRLHGANLINFPPRFNLAPEDFAPVVLFKSENTNEVALKKWGLVPFWAKDAKTTYRMINAKAETVFEKPAYKEAVKKRRCIVPATGFYEWQINAEGKKIPHYIFDPKEKYLAFAGIYESWVMPETETALESFSIITTSANVSMQGLHERMPLILTPETEAIWLDPASETEAVESILAAIPKIQLENYQVSQLVNSPRNDFPELLKKETGA